MSDTSKEQEYYTAAEVAKIKGIRRQSVIDGCHRGQYPGAYKTVPDALNRQGVWRIPKTAVDQATATQDVVTLSRPMTPDEIQNTIQQAVSQAVSTAITERMAQIEDRLEERDRLLLEAIRAIQDRDTAKKDEVKKPWYKFW